MELRHERRKAARKHAMGYIIYIFSVANYKNANSQYPNVCEELERGERRGERRARNSVERGTGGKEERTWNSCKANS